MDTSKAFKDIGFTQNEIDVYTYILKKGLVDGPEVYKNLTMDKSSFYRSLSVLKKKGLIYAQGATRNQKFKAAPASKLLSIQKQKEQEIRNASLGIKEFIKDVNRYSRSRYKSANIKIFEGERAYFDFMEEMVKGKVDIIRDLSPGVKYVAEFAQTSDRYYTFIHGFIKRRFKKGIKIRILQDSTITDQDELDVSNPKTLKEGRKFPGELNLEGFLNTSGDRTGLFTRRAGGFWGIIIKDRIITNLMNSMFDVLWGMSEKV